MDNNYLGEEKVSKLLKKFSIPCVLSLVIQALYNLVDQIFIGHKTNLGGYGNAATGIVYGLTVIALGIGLMVGDGVAASMAINQGRKDQEKTSKNVGNGLLLGLIFGIVLSILCLSFRAPLLKLIGGDGKILEFAINYSIFIFLGFTLYILSSVLNPIIRADGSPVFAMATMIIGAVLNIILDPIFLFVFDMDLTGAALATFIGQAITFILSILYLFKSKTFKLSITDFKLNKECLQLLKLGMSSFLTQFSIFLITLVNNIILFKISVPSGYDTAITQGAITLAFKVFGIVISVAIGIVSGGAPIIGYNFGANNIKRVKQTFKCILISVFVVGVIATLLFEIYPNLFLYIFGDGGEGIDKEAYKIFVFKTFRIYLSCILATCLVKVISIFFQAIGKAKEATIITVCRDVIFLVPAALILGLCFNVDAFLWSAPIADILGLILSIILLYIENKKLNK